VIILDLSLFCIKNKLRKTNEPELKPTKNKIIVFRVKQCQQIFVLIGLFHHERDAMFSSALLVIYFLFLPISISGVKTGT